MAKRRFDHSLRLRSLSPLSPKKLKTALQLKRQILMAKFLFNLKPKPRPAKLRQLPVYTLNEKMRFRDSPVRCLMSCARRVDFCHQRFHLSYIDFVHRSDAVKAYIPFVRS